MIGLALTMMATAALSGDDRIVYACQVKPNDGPVISPVTIEFLAPRGAAGNGYDTRIRNLRFTDPDNSFPLLKPAYGPIAARVTLTGVIEIYPKGGRARGGIFWVRLVPAPDDQSAEFSALDHAFGPPELSSLFSGTCKGRKPDSVGRGK